MVLTSLTLTLSVIVLTFLIVIFWKKNAKLPPGPWGLPFFGYYPFLSDKPYIDFYKLSERYGDVISFRTVGGKLIVVLNGAKVIKNVLVNRSEEFVGRPEEDNLLAWISDGLGITQEEGLPWKAHRHFFIHSLKSLGLGNQDTETRIQEEIKTLIKDVKKSNGEPIDLSFHIAYAVNSVINPILFAKKYEKFSSEFKEVADGARYLVEQFVTKQYLLVGRLYKYIVMTLFPSTKNYRKAKESFERIAKTIVDDHVETFDPSNIRDYVDSFLYEAHKLHKHGGVKEDIFTRDRLYGITLNMLMEGTETVAGTLFGMLIEIARHPEEQKLVQEELGTVVGEERLPSWADRRNMPYFRAFLQELSRVCAPFNLSTYYSNFEETTLQGYRIPKRSILVANLWTINNDPFLYPNPKKFDPKRFLEDQRNKNGKVGPCIYGVGKRTCIVESLADKETFLVISSILQNFTLIPAKKEDLIKAVPRISIAV